MVDTAAKEYRKTNTSRTEERKCESLDTKSMNIIKKNNKENRFIVSPVNIQKTRNTIDKTSKGSSVIK
jgi:hypothetical protein